MLQLDNRSPFTVAVASFADEEGRETLVAAIKATFSTSPVLRLADKQRPVEVGDRYHGDAAVTSLAAAGELTLPKTSTDVVMVGDARTHRDRPAQACAVSLTVAERTMKIAVYGDRWWESLGRISPPRPFVRMPLVWERAFGGIAPDRGKDGLRISDLNPVGVGLLNRVGDRLPNLEDPRTPIQGHGDLPSPVCFAPLSPGWGPRRQHAGTYDADWARKQCPYLPRDFNRRFFDVAPSPFAFDRPLFGGEPVEALGVAAAGGMRFNIPRVGLLVNARINGGWERMQTLLQRVTLYPDDDEVALLFGGAFPADRRLLAIERISVEVYEEAA